MARASEPRSSTSAQDQIDCGRLTTTIDFDFEFDLVAFVQAGQTRTLYSTDVHECVRLAILAGDEAEALGRIEELDRAAGTFTGRLALCRSLAARGNDHLADDRQVARRDLAATIDQLECKLLTFSKGRQASVLHGTDVHECIVAAIFTLDEAEALVRVEELNHTAAFADDLRRRTATTRTAAEAAARTATEATARTAAAEAITTAETVAAAKAVTTAEAIATTETVVTAAEPVTAVTAISSVK